MPSRGIASSSSDPICYSHNGPKSDILDVIPPMVFAPDGRMLATGGYDKMVKLWSIRPNAQLSRDR
jgi:WD40 repeat protein